MNQKDPEKEASSLNSDHQPICCTNCHHINTVRVLPNGKAVIVNGSLSRKERLKAIVLLACAYCDESYEAVVNVGKRSNVSWTRQCASWLLREATKLPDGILAAEAFPRHSGVQIDRTTILLGSQRVEALREKNRVFRALTTDMLEQAVAVWGYEKQGE